MSDSPRLHFHPLLRRRVGVELSLLVLLTPLFLLAVPRLMALYAAAGLGLIAYVLGTRRQTERRIWRPVRRRECPPGEAVRLRLGLFTATGLGLSWGWAQWHGIAIPYGHLLLAALAYFPWALLQQTLFQFYFLGRLRVLLPGASVAALALLNGAVFALVHLPQWPLALAAGGAGAVWSLAYQRHGRLLPVAASHAMLGAGFYYLVVGRDLIGAWLT